VPADVLVAAAEEVKKYGFINYFGTQRFGTGTIATHDIGRLLLQGRWEEAIDFLLKPRPFEEPKSTEARKYYRDTGDVSGTISKMPKKHVIERNLLFGIKKHGRTLNALDELAYNLRLLYVHAYQSYVFNIACSRRIEYVNHLNPVVGDIVLNPETNKYEYVTSETISKHTIHDVYLPLPGFDVIYPDNDLGVWIKEFMIKDGIDPDDMKRPQKVFSLPGGYRKVLSKPKLFDYKIVRYDDYTIPLAKTDLDILKAKELPEPKMEGAGKLLGMVLEMILESSTYATMVIRELTKSETGVLHQRSVQANVVDKEKGEGKVAIKNEDDNEEEEVDEAFIEGGAYDVDEEGTNA
jgi:tRNA pseudouridine13 synthase